MKQAASIGLALALAFAGAISACGPSNPDPEVAPTPTGEPSATAPVMTAAPTADPMATGAPTATETAPAAPAAPPGPPVVASKMAEDLKKAGFDIAKLPPKLDKMSKAQKKKIMPLFVKSLGFEDCTGCHVEGDFKKKTRNMNIAEHMYDEFVAGLRDEAGNATIFCDSCHQGKADILNRSDKKALGKYMDEQYVGHLARADKGDHGCATCHGELMEMKVFEKMWEVGKGL